MRSFTKDSSLMQTIIEGLEAATVHRDAQLCLCISINIIYLIMYMKSMTVSSEKQALSRPWEQNISKHLPKLTPNASYIYIYIFHFGKGNPSMTSFVQSKGFTKRLSHCESQGNNCTLALTSSLLCSSL